MQNDSLKEIALYIVRQICRDVAHNGFYTQMNVLTCLIKSSLLYV